MYTVDDVINVAKKSGNFIFVDNVKKTPVSRQSLQNFISVLINNEELLYFMESACIERGNSNIVISGYLAVTNERVIIYGSQLFRKGPNVSTLSIDNIVSVNPVRGLNGKLIVDTVGVTDRIFLDCLAKNEINTMASRFMESINKAKEMKNATNIVQ